MTEQQIQTKKIKQLEELGYYVIKLIKTNKNGIPDLVALHPCVLNQWRGCLKYILCNNPVLPSLQHDIYQTPT